MYRLFFLTAVCIALTAKSTPVEAGHRHHRCCVTCPKCQTCCELEVEKADDEKYCYQIECEEICVPCFVFPWQNHRFLGRKCKSGSCSDGCSGDGCTDGSCGACCPRPNHNGARVITVRRFKKHTYECPTCKYSWTPKKKKTGNCNGDCGHCSAQNDSPQTDDLPVVVTAETPFEQITPAVSTKQEPSAQQPSKAASATVDRDKGFYSLFREYRDRRSAISAATAVAPVTPVTSGVLFGDE